MKYIMNKSKIYLLALLTIAIAVSCDPEDDRVTWNGSYVEFDATTSSAAYLRTNDGENVSGELQVNLVAVPSKAATTVNVEVNTELTTAVAGVHYVDLSGGSIDIEAGSNLGSIPFEVIDDNIEAGETWVLAYNITGSDTDLGSKVTNSHSMSVSCLLSPEKTEGDWVLDMQDSYGDGWNGASVQFEIDGVLGPEYTIADGPPPNNNVGQAIISVPSGVETLRFFFNSGDWDGEITFQITAPNDVEVGSYGPSPLEGEFEVNNCLL